jgi:FtsZ-interacting cell division protein ZipA
MIVTVVAAVMIVAGAVALTAIMVHGWLRASDRLNDCARKLARRRGVYNSVRMRYGIHIEFATATAHRSLQ